MSLSPDAILRHTERPVPRYTSYPTAPHFHAGVDAGVYRGWLRQLPESAALSLYVHVPFCDTLCWFCGCHTKITRQYAPIADYLEALKREITAVAAHVPASARLAHLHWGGGSPTILTPMTRRGSSTTSTAPSRPPRASSSRWRSTRAAWTAPASTRSPTAG